LDASPCGAGPYLAILLSTTLNEADSIVNANQMSSGKKKPLGGGLKWSHHWRRKRSNPDDTPGILFVETPFDDLTFDLPVV